MEHTEAHLPYVIVDDEWGGTYQFVPVIEEQCWHYADTAESICLVKGATIAAICRTLLKRAVRSRPAVVAQPAQFSLALVEAS